MNKTKKNLPKIKDLFDGVFEKLENITLDKKMRLSRFFYFLLVPLLLFLEMSVEPWEILATDGFQIEKLLFIETIFIVSTCILFLLPIRKSLILSGLTLLMSYLFTKFLGNQVVLYVSKLFSLNEVYRFLIYCFATCMIFLFVGEVFLRIVRKSNSSNCNFEKKNSDVLSKV